MEIRYQILVAIMAGCLIGLGSASPAAEASNDAAEMSLWQQAVSSGEPEDLQAFLDRYPDSEFAADARGLLATLLPADADTPVNGKDEKTVESNDARQGATTLSFEQAVEGDVQSDKPRSIKELAEGNPLFSPVEDLPREYWEAEVCSNCHNWDKAALCTQGEFYTAQEGDRSTRIQHPYGGFFKKALEQWAAGGCQ